ncbi:MAG: hypothetical protein OER90_14265 [Gemmatimonadota bacterium]|nr:hypothetical protein [Gemmatimonadota bacterium]
MSHVRWLRLSYWVGAIADAVATVAILIPARMGESDFRYPMGLAAALMLAWTVLLIWGDRKPVERRGILLLTVFPLIPGLMASGIAAGVAGQLPLGQVVARSVVLAGILLLILYSYLKANRAVARAA